MKSLINHNHYSHFSFFLHAKFSSSSKTVTFYFKSFEHDLDKKIKASLNLNLSLILKENGVPLICECNQSTNCGTCAIKCDNINEFEEISRKLPLNNDEKLTIGTKTIAHRLTRLSCRLKTDPILEGKTFWL